MNTKEFWKLCFCGVLTGSFITFVLWSSVEFILQDKSVNPVLHTKPSEANCEVWTDEKTGHRFLVATRKWNIGGVGICLIPDFKKEENEEHIKVPHPRDLDSRIDTLFERK